MADIVDLLQIKIEKAKGGLPEETLNAISAVDWKAVILGMRTSKGYNFDQLGDLELETELLLCGLLNPTHYPKELEKRMRLSRMAANELVNEMNILVFKKIKEELIKNSERKKIFANKSATSVAKPKVAEPAIPPTPAFGEVKVPTPNRDVGINKVDVAVLKSAGIEVVKPEISNAENKAGADTPIEAREEILKKVEHPEETTRPVRSPEGSQGVPTSNGIHPMLQQKILSSVQTPTVKTEYTLENISKNSDGLEKPETQKETKKSGYSVDPYRLPPE